MNRRKIVSYSIRYYLHGFVCLAQMLHLLSHTGNTTITSVYGSVGASDELLAQIILYSDNHLLFSLARLYSHDSRIVYRLALLHTDKPMYEWMSPMSSCCR